MPFRPSQTDMHVDVPMSNLSIAYVQSDVASVVARMTSPIPVQNQSNYYATYTKNQWFQDEAQLRSPATESAGSDFTVGKELYYCEEYAFHKDIPDEIRNNADAPFRVDNDARRFVDTKLLLKRDILLQDAIFKDGVWATDVVGATDFVKWSEYGTSVPNQDTEDARDAIHSITAEEITHFLIGRQCWRSIKFHPTLIEKIKYTQKGVLTTDLFAALLEIPQIVIGSSIKATNVEGATEAYSYIYGKHGLFLHSNPRPSLLTATAFLSFIWARQGRSVTVRRLRNEWKRFDRIEGYFNIDHRIVGTDLGYYMQDLVA